MVAGLLPAPNLPVHSRGCQSAGGRRSEQQVVDPQPGVSPPGAARVIPEGVDPTGWVPLPDGIRPPLDKQPAVCLPRFDLRKTNDGMSLSYDCPIASLQSKILSNRFESYSGSFLVSSRSSQATDTFHSAVTAVQISSPPLPAQRSPLLFRRLKPRPSDHIRISSRKTANKRGAMPTEKNERSSLATIHHLAYDVYTSIVARGNSRHGCINVFCSPPVCLHDDPSRLAGSGQSIRYRSRPYRSERNPAGCLACGSKAPERAADSRCRGPLHGPDIAL